MRKWLSLLLPGLLWLAYVPAQGAVWQDTRHWNQSAEDEFSRWIQTLPLDIFSNPRSPYHGIATDCADAAYVLRMIFAYEHSLPVRFLNSDSLSNRSTKFDSIADPHQRVLSFMAEVRRVTGTATLSQDTYPIAIGRASIRPGTLFLKAEEGPEVHVTFRPGHVYYIQGVAANGIIKYISSTVPAAVRTLSPRYGIDFAPYGTTSGYRAWIWPDSNERPNASDEQFRMAGWRPKAYGDVDLAANWQDAIQSRLRSRLPTSLELLQAASDSLRAQLIDRVQAVRDAWAFYQKYYVRRGLRCMNDGDYDRYSTPTRDEHVQAYLRDVQNAADAARDQLPQPHAWFGNGDAVQAYMDSQKVEVLPGVQLSYAQLWNTFRTETAYTISEPEHPPQVRWGLVPMTREQATCPNRVKVYRGS